MKYDIFKVKIEGYDPKDYPDFNKSQITYAEWANGSPLNFWELKRANENRELVYSAILDQYILEGDSEEEF